MKNLSLIIVSLLFSSNNGKAQVHQNGIGLRYGTGNAFRNSEFTYQLGLGQSDRLQFGLGYQQRNDGIYAFQQLSTSIYYQHVWNIKGGFNWFLGAGIKYDYAKLKQFDQTYFHHNFTAGPTIGLEYDFNHKNVPLVLALDYRPSFVYSKSFGGHVGFDNQFGLSLHYTFGDKKK